MPITSIDIQNRIPLEHRYFIAIISNPLPDHYLPCVDALIESIVLYVSKARVQKKIYIQISQPPFVMNLSNGSLAYAPRSPDIINLHLDDFIIYLDFEKMSRLQHEYRMACILEELVHAIMGVKCELLVSQVVASVYSGITLNSANQYQAVVAS